MRPSVDENEFIRICQESSSVREVSRKLKIDKRAVERRIARLKPKYGDFSPAQKQKYAKPVKTLDYEGTIVVFSDSHFWPEYYHPQSRIYYVMLEVVTKIKPDLIIDNGDSFDGFPISRHPPHGWAEGPTVREELDINIQRHKEIKKAAKGAQLLWLWGNHDARFDSYLALHAPHVRDINGSSLEHHFPDWEFCEGLNINDSLQFYHNWKGGAHAAYNNALHAGISVVSGHSHRCTVRAVTDLRGTRYGIESGTLCDPKGPQFFYVGGRPADWQPGFIVLTVEGKEIHPEPVLLREDGKAFFRGKFYS